MCFIISNFKRDNYEPSSYSIIGYSEISLSKSYNTLGSSRVLAPKVLVKREKTLLDIVVDNIG